MERDFMGLNSKESVAVKEESVDGGFEDSGFKRNSGVPVSVSDKATAFPHFMPLKSEQDENPSKMNTGLLASHGYKNFGGSTMKHPFLAGSQVSAPNSLPTAAVVGVTELWTSSKASNASAQLTIFYGGTVTVFDGITPEKAEAIMLLAGAGCIPANTAQQKLHIQGAVSKHPAADPPMVKQNMAPGSGLPSPMSVSSHPADCGVLAANNNDIKGSKTAGMTTNIVTKGELPKGMTPLGSMAASAIISSAVPLTRKASLARFLEKRKERVMNASPYSLSNKKTPECATPESNGIGFSATSGASSSSVSIGKEISGDA